jgi:hypothetical protein
MIHTVYEVGDPGFPAANVLIIEGYVGKWIETTFYREDGSELPGRIRHERPMRVIARTQDVLEDLLEQIAAPAIAYRPEGIP